MGSQRAKAIQAARQLNALLVKDVCLVDQVLGKGDTVAEYAIRWYDEILPARKLSASTLLSYLSSRRAIVATWGRYRLQELSAQVIAEGLATMTRSGATAVRGRLADMLKEALADGLVQDNQAQITRKPRMEVVRKRMTQAQYDAIHAHAAPWLQRAMELGLLTLQRASDILEMRFDQARDGHLFVIQQKTQKHDTGYLKIEINAELKALLSLCRDRTPSPLLVHRVPERKRKDKPGHWTRIPYYTLRIEFDRARTACGLFDDWDKGSAPTFHEIRALGIKLCKDRGMDPQLLAGHASAKMTSNYDSRHDDIRWVEVSL